MLGRYGLAPLVCAKAQTIGFDRLPSCGDHPHPSSVKTGVQVPVNTSRVHANIIIASIFYARSEDVEPEKTAMRSFHRVLRCRKLTTGTNSAQNRFKVPVNTSRVHTNMDRASVLFYLFKKQGHGIIRDPAFSLGRYGLAPLVCAKA